MTADAGRPAVAREKTARLGVVASCTVSLAVSTALLLVLHGGRPTATRAQRSPHRLVFGGHPTASRAQRSPYRPRAQRSPHRSFSVCVCRLARGAVVPPLVEPSLKLRRRSRFCLELRTATTRARSDCPAMPRTFYYLQECPVAHECTDAAFKRAAVWDFDETEARARLVKHLVNSGNHKMPEDDAEIIANHTEFLVGDWPDASDEKPTKKKRGDEESKGSGDAVPRTPPGGPSAADVLKEIQGLKSAVSAVAKMHEVKSEVRGPRASSSTTVAKLAGSRSDILMVNAETVRLACDGLERAHTAARHAQRLCTAAASAFSTEAEVINEAKQILSNIVNS